MCYEVFNKNYKLDQHVKSKICTKATDVFQCNSRLKYFTNKWNLDSHMSKVNCGTSGVQFDPKEVFHSVENDFILNQIDDKNMKFLDAKKVGAYKKNCYPLLFSNKRDRDLTSIENFFPNNKESESILAEIIRGCFKNKCC